MYNDVWLDGLCGTLLWCRDLDTDQLVCDCHLAPFLSAALNAPLLLLVGGEDDPAPVTCASPPHLRGVPLRTILPSQLNCGKLSYLLRDFTNLHASVGLLLCGTLPVTQSQAGYHRAWQC